MEKPKIKLITKVKNKTHGGNYPSFWAVQFYGGNIFYATKKHLSPCSICKSKKSNYLIFQKGKDKNHLYCPSCTISDEVKDLETQKFGIKMIETV